MPFSLKQLAADERGAEVLEYALIVGLIVIGCIAAIALIGSRVQIGWQYISSRL